MTNISDLVVRISRAGNLKSLYRILSKIGIRHLGCDGVNLEFAQSKILSRPEEQVELPVRKAVVLHAKLDCGSHAMSLAVWQGGNKLAAATFFRAKGNFFEKEVRILRKVSPHFASTVRRMNHEQSWLTYRLGVEYIFRRHPQSIILVSWDLRIIYYNDAARWAVVAMKYGHGYKFKPAPKLELPTEIFVSLDSLKNQIAQGSCLFTRSHFIGGLDCEISYVPSPKGISRGLFVLTSQVVERRQDHLLVGRLSRAEREVYRHLRDGMAYKQIAHQMSKGMGTIKNQVRSIYAKLGVKRRIEL